MRSQTTSFHSTVLLMVCLLYVSLPTNSVLGQPLLKPIASVMPNPLNFTLEQNNTIQTITVLNASAKGCKPTPDPTGIKELCLSNAPLIITNVSLSGLPTNNGDFNIALDGCSGHTLKSGERCFILIELLPQSVNPSTTLTVGDNAFDSPQQVPISGIGLIK